MTETHTFSPDRGRFFPWFYLLLAGIDLSGRLWWMEGTRLEIFSKPLPLLALLLYFLWMRNPWGRGRDAWLMPLALLGSWLGDVLLMFPGQGFFMAGLSSFLIAHIIYTLVFGEGKPMQRLLQTHSPTWIVLGFVPAGLLLGYLWPHLPPAMRLPVGIYALVISMMMLSALSRQGRVPETSFRMVALGAILFVVSDAILALNRFAQEALTIPKASFWVMATYLSAQYLIVQGVLSEPED
jgi:uncharacterized membrane protein YhhN